MDTTIIGLAHVGKTTLLEALAGAAVSGSGTATVRVRDKRVEALSDIFKPKRTVFGEIRVREAGWPGTGESQRKSEMERYLNAIRGSGLFLHVLAAVQTPMMTEEADPAAALQKLDGEMIFSDLLSVERVLERGKKAPLEANVKALLLRIKEVLESDRPLWCESITDAEKAMVAGFNLVTMTPQLIIVNTAEDAGGSFDASVFGDRLYGRHVMSLCFPTAREVSFLPVEEQDAFAKELGLTGPAADSVSREVFSQLDLISFFTVGEDECRAWPVSRGIHARAAAGEIHSDIERGFIRAEVVAYDEFMKRKSLKACRDEGVLRLEGKDYPVQDGDIVHYRFNV